MTGSLQLRAPVVEPRSRHACTSPCSEPAAHFVAPAADAVRAELGIAAELPLELEIELATCLCGRGRRRPHLSITVRVRY